MSHTSVNLGRKVVSLSPKSYSARFATVRVFRAGDQKVLSGRRCVVPAASNQLATQEYRTRPAPPTARPLQTYG